LPYFDIGDCGFDIKKNPLHARSTCSIPVFDYNKRKEKTDIKSLRKRGYDKKGTPFAPCGASCKSNGYDEKKKKSILYLPKAVSNLTRGGTQSHRGLQVPGHRMWLLYSYVYQGSSTSHLRDSPRFNSLEKD